MEDLISREALLEEIKENQWGWFSREMMILMLESQPTVEAVPVVHGEWKKRKSWEKYVCSKCSYEFNLPYNFCPNCGADMKKKV